MKKIMIALAVVLMFGCAITTQTRDQIIEATIKSTQEKNFVSWLENEVSQYQLVIQAQTQSDARVTILDYIIYDSYSAGLAKIKVELPNREMVGHFVVLRPVANWVIYSFVLISNNEVENNIKRQLEADNNIEEQIKKQAKESVENEQQF